MQEEHALNSMKTGLFKKFFDNNNLNLKNVERLVMLFGKQVKDRAFLIFNE